MTATTLLATGLGYATAGRTILEGVELQVHAGRLLAVRGPSGAGKSSLLGVLAGLLPPSAGRVTLDGAAVAEPEVRRRTSVVLQGYGLVTALTARENVAIALQARRLPRAEVRQRTAATLADVGLTEVADHLVEDLSGGQQQRVAVARALATGPELMLADEPTAELDADNRERIVALLVEVARRGSVVVIASHDLDVVQRCDDVLTLEAGRVVAEETHLSAGPR